MVRLPTPADSTPRRAPGGSAERVDRLFTITLAISLAGHVVVFGAQLMFPSWSGFSHLPRPLRLIYEKQVASGTSHQTVEELRQVESKRMDLPGPSSTPLDSSAMRDRQLGGGLKGVVGAALPNLTPQIRIGEGSTGGLPSGALPSGTWSSAIDLTNLAQVAQGNPVLLSYFCAIREQIQQTANQRPWLSGGASSEGVVYVGFVIRRSGDIQSATVMPDRSVPSDVLREVALRIVKAANPFPPFPPSFTEPAKTIMVPIEFSLGPS